MDMQKLQTKYPLLITYLKENGYSNDDFGESVPCNSLESVPGNSLESVPGVPLKVYQFYPC